MSALKVGIVSTIAVLMVFSGCGASDQPQGSSRPSSGATSSASNQVEMATPPALSITALEAIRGSRIFFAHRSVGADIVEKGLPAVYRDNGVAGLRVVAGAPLEDGSFGDQWLVQTDDPHAKLKDFDLWVRERGVGESAEIAYMKLGYIDIDAETDVESLFRSYRSLMESLEVDYPNVKFLHVTVSVTRWQSASNATIERFNALMRAEYGAAGRLFDLAAAVSRCSDGNYDRHLTDDGEVYFQICEEYTRDGGHLNELGAKVAATEMLGTLGAVVQ